MVILSNFDCLHDLTNDGKQIVVHIKFILSVTCIDHIVHAGINE